MLHSASALKSRIQEFPNSNHIYSAPFRVILGTTVKRSDHLQWSVAYRSEGDMKAHRFHTTDGDFTLDLDHPPICTKGKAYTPDSGTMIEADVKQIFFNKVRDSVSIGRPAGYIGAVPGSLNFSWSDQTVIALGVRNPINEQTTLRFGINHGASPNLSTNLAFTHALENEVTSSVGLFYKLKMYQKVLTFNLTMDF